MNTNRIPRFLGTLFLIYGVLLTLDLWHYLTAVIPILSGQEMMSWALIVLKPPWSVSLKLFWLAMTLLTAIGMFRAVGWARWLGLFFAGSLPIGYLNRGLMLGAATVVTPTSVCSSVVALLVFLFLWKSDQAEQIFGSNRKAARNAWASLAIFCLIPFVLFGFVIYIKVSNHLSHLSYGGHRVYQTNEAVVEEGFTTRELLNFQIVVPSQAQVFSIKKRPHDGGATVALWAPNKNISIFIGSKAVGELMMETGQFLGIRTPYDIHRHELLSEWNVVFLIMKAVTIPYLGNDMRVTELEAPGWKGLVIGGNENNAFRREYSIYGKDNLHQSVSCLWSVRGGALSVSQVEHSMGAFKFLPTVKTREPYVEQAHSALSDGRQIDAQFALAQAYLLGDKDPTVTMKLAEVSAGLGSWVLVKHLAQELLADDPENEAVKALYQSALKASEQKDVTKLQGDVLPSNPE